MAMPPELAARCPRADYAAVKTVGDLATFALQDDADLGVCDARRAAAVALVKAQSAAATTTAPPWWRFWR